MITIKSYSLWVCVLIGLISLAGTCKKRVVKRIDPNEIRDISGRWNDTDSRLIAQRIVLDVINGNWIYRHEKENKDKKPVVIIGMIRNKTHEHIDTETFMKAIEASFVKTGMIHLVEGGKKRDELRAERADQQIYAASSTVKKWGLEKGADYILQGSIHSIIDHHKKNKISYYRVALQLTHLQNNEVVWMKDEEIKKHIKN